MFLNLCLHMIWFFTAKFNIDLRVCHISGSLNVVADALSRNRLESLKELQWDYVSPQVLSSLCRFEPYFEVSLEGALSRVKQGLQPHMRSQYPRQFKLYLAFAIWRDFVILDNVNCVLLFLGSQRFVF